MIKKYNVFTITLLIIIGLLVGCSNDEEDKTHASNSKIVANGSIEDMHNNYEIRGKECKEFDNVLERGDCFQSVNEKYLNWKINIMKDFQYTYVPQEEEWQGWQDVFIFSINEADELVSTQQTAYYDEYLEKHSLDFVQSKEEIVQSYWYIFSNVFPQEYRKDLKKVMVNDFDGIFFQVIRDELNIDDTLFVISDDITEYDPQWYRWNLIHEFAHILTSNREQMTVESEFHLSVDEEILKAAESNCPTILLFGCWQENSYINQFHAEFWEEILPAYEAIDWTVEEDHHEFYQEYNDYFFNAYQAMYPTEDIAESFAFFIMLNSDELEKPEVKYEKVKFFYQYEELVELRSQILENLYDLSVRDKKFY
jgi:hypothetical protein